MKSYDIAIIGGGASGITAAISAARTAPRLKICILEKQERVGKKILATGNGKCNLSNANISSEHYHGDTSFAMDVISRYPSQKIISFFDSIGVLTRQDSEGRIYPLCEQASAVLDDLRFCAFSHGIEEICSFECTSVQQSGGEFFLSGKTERLTAKKVILCTGSKAAPKLGGSDSGLKLLSLLGHPVKDTHPALVPVDMKEGYFSGLKGQRIKGTVKLFSDKKELRRESGEILFTESGLSGICVMQLAALADASLRSRKDTEISIEILHCDQNTITTMLSERARLFSAREAGDYLTGITSKRIGQVLCKLAGIIPLSTLCSDITDKQIIRLSELLTDWRMHVSGIKGYDAAQVTSGGAETAAFSSETLESRIVRGLYAAGELLDVDGDCGGYNLQWAWSSGLLSGQSAAASIIGGK